MTKFNIKKFMSKMRKKKLDIDEDVVKQMILDIKKKEKNGTIKKMKILDINDDGEIINDLILDKQPTKIFTNEENRQIQISNNKQLQKKSKIGDKSFLLNAMKEEVETNEIDKAISLTVSTLADTNKERLFSDLSNNEIDTIAILESVYVELGWSQGATYLLKRANWKVSNKRGGRKEMEGIGKSGVDRNSQNNGMNLMGRLRERF